MIMKQAAVPMGQPFCLPAVQYFFVNIQRIVSDPDHDSHF